MIKKFLAPLLLFTFSFNVFAADTGFKSPTANDGTGTWTNPNNAHASDDIYATASITAVEKWKTYAFGFVGSEIIDGIEIQIEAKKNVSAPIDLIVDLSWDGGTSWTATKTLTWTETIDTIKTYGSSTDLWGRASWDDAELSDANFRVRIELASSSTGSMDHTQTKIYYNSGILRRKSATIIS